MNTALQAAEKLFLDCEHAEALEGEAYWAELLQRLHENSNDPEQPVYIPESGRTADDAARDLEIYAERSALLKLKADGPKREKKSLQLAKAFEEGKAEYEATIAAVEAKWKAIQSERRSFGNQSEVIAGKLAGLPNLRPTWLTQEIDSFAGELEEAEAELEKAGWRAPNSLTTRVERLRRNLHGLREYAANLPDVPWPLPPTPAELATVAVGGHEGGS